MATHSLSFNIPNEFLDPITYDIMKDPVIFNNNVYEKKIISKYLKEKNIDPATNVPITSPIELKPAKELKKEIMKWKKSLTFKQKWELFFFDFDFSWAKLNQFLNPFDAIRYQGKTLVDSRSLTTNTKTKIADSYRVLRGNAWGLDYFFKGKMEVEENFSELGFFDYATLGIFLGVQALSNYFLRAYFEIMDSYSKDASTGKKISAISLMVLIILGGMLVSFPHVIGNGMLRPLIAGGLAFAFLPFTLLAQGITKIIAKIKERKLLHSTNFTFEDGSTKTLHAALGITNLKQAVIEIHDNQISFTHRIQEISCTTVNLKKATFKDLTEKIIEIDFETRKTLLPEECEPRHRF